MYLGLTKTPDNTVSAQSEFDGTEISLRQELRHTRTKIFFIETLHKMKKKRNEICVKILVKIFSKVPPATVPINRNNI